MGVKKIVKTQYLGTDELEGFSFVFEPVEDSVTIEKIKKQKCKGVSMKERTREFIGHIRKSLRDERARMARIRHVVEDEEMAGSEKLDLIEAITDQSVMAK